MHIHLTIRGCTAALKCLSILLCMLTFSFYLQGQNTSYNANSIPISGTNNIAIGFGALFSNTSGFSNTAIGWQALASNISGSQNTAVGWVALSQNTNGIRNTAVGLQALTNNSAGSDNTANGWNALASNSTGNYNTAQGSGALGHNTLGIGNTTGGFNSLFSNISGNYNTAQGYDALSFNVTGSYNTASGLQALRLNTTGTFNTASGSAALYNNSSGSRNTAFGDSAGYNSLGSGNVFIGHQAGAVETGSNKLYIGNADIKTLLYGDFSTGQLLLGRGDATGYIFKGNRTLNVLGGVLADSVRTALSGDWADHVFKKDYKLKSLEELEQFISSNKRLPGIPAANEVAANGINLAEMDSKLLEKIEELTLYVIELKKENQRQQEEINELKSQDQDPRPNGFGRAGKKNPRSKNQDSNNHQKTNPK